MNKGKTSIIVAITICILSLIPIGCRIYRNEQNKPNINLHGNKQYSLYITDTTKFDDIVNRLIADSVIINTKKFINKAKKEEYPEHIKPGRYVLLDGMSNNSLLTILINGEQTPVKVIFNSTKNIFTLASKVSSQIAADSASIVDTYFDTSFLSSIGMNRNDAFLMIIPNTYEFYWNTDSKGFWKRMKKESDIFWNNKDRKQTADSIKLSLSEVVILASIVERETHIDGEKKTIAGVYMNRLLQRNKLQADPTLIFAWDDYSIKRVLNRHREIDSPYNTYKYAGLPPGPIWIPSIYSIDAVLNYERHQYLFFCASPDSPGHSFAKTYAQHLENAKKYHKFLNEINTE